MFLQTQLWQYLQQDIQFRGTSCICLLLMLNISVLRRFANKYCTKHWFKKGKNQNMNRKCSFVTKEIWLCHFKQCITHRFRFIPKKEKSISINTYVLMFAQDVICGFSLVSCILFSFNVLVYLDHALPLFCTKVLLGGNVICTNA